MSKPSLIQQIKSDFPASIVVFFVALPLCLGVALASGAPLFSGVIAGIVGGIMVGALSGSKIGVSGPAAGLAAIVLSAIATLGSYENFLVAVVLAGIFQIVLGFLKAGVIGYYFPSSVIKGMLTAIGIIIVLKQIPHFFGYDTDYQGDLSFWEHDGENTFSAIFHTLNHIRPGSALIGIVGLTILIFWDKVLSKKGKIFQLIQGPLVAVVLGIVFYILTKDNEVFHITPDHLVQVPVTDGLMDFLGVFTKPNFAAIADSEVWVVAFTIGLVASLETLLSVEATDKLDPHKNVTPTNRELFAQGAGNIVSGMIGGLPITQVIVRSSANIQSGGSSKFSTIMHGMMLLLCVMIIPTVLNMIPLSVLAAVLLVVGYKLAKPANFIIMYKLGRKQFVPFMITVLGIVFTDLLVGIGMGLLAGIVVILFKSYKNSHFLHKEGEDIDDGMVKMTLAEEVTFFNKGAILLELENLPNDSKLVLDVRNTVYLDHDIVEILDDFVIKAGERNIEIKLVSESGEFLNLQSYLEFFQGNKAYRRK